MSHRPIGFIDSGIGGITTLSTALDILPHEDYIYLADFSSMPYGNKSKEYILARTIDNCYTLLNRGCKAIVVACNTATNVGISFLRDYNTFLSECIYVGLEPAVKPAIKSGAKKILVLVTEATAAQAKFDALIKDYSERLTIESSKTLAVEIEKAVGDRDKLDGIVRGIMKGKEDADAVVLGCTHYIYLKESFIRLYGNRYALFDGNEGAIKQLKRLLEAKDLLNPSEDNGVVSFIRK